MEDLYPTTMEAINKIIIEFPCHHQLDDEGGDPPFFKLDSAKNFTQNKR